MSLKEGKAVKVTMDILGERGYPLEQVKLPEAVISDLREIVEYAQERYPGVSVEDVIKGIWRHGTKSFWYSLRIHKANAFKFIQSPDELKALMKQRPTRG